jgi:hypothetical protein
MGERPRSRKHGVFLEESLVWFSEAGYNLECDQIMAGVGQGESSRRLER